MKTTTECKCGNSGCAVRSARGLVPFCQMPAPERKWDGFYSSYSEACAASPVGRAKWVMGGGTTGSPSRFKAVQG